MTSWIERLARLDTSVTSDVLDEAGYPDQVLSAAFTPLDRNARLCGEALCAQGQRLIRSQTPAPASLSGYTIERSVSAGQVVVLDAGPESIGAAIGGFLAATLKAKGAAGLVVNGAVRDAAEIRDLGLPTYCRFVTPVNAARRWQLSGVGIALSLPGTNGVSVAIRPGDLILGDTDGVVVIPSEAAQPLVEAGEELQRIEGVIRDEIAAGASREQAFARHPRFDHVRRLAPANRQGT